MTNREFVFHKKSEQLIGSLIPAKTMNSIVKTGLVFAFALLLCACQNSTEPKGKIESSPVELYNTFDKDNHLQPGFDKKRFDTLHTSELAWAMLEPIYNAADKDTSEIKLARQLSPGQKALYFYWHLDAEVSNGGFVQFYWNGYRKYLPPIKEGLRLVGDTAMQNLIAKADKEYLANDEAFDSQRQKDDWSPLYNNLKELDNCDNKFFQIQNRTMELFELYIRKNPAEFVKLN